MSWQKIINTLCQLFPNTLYIREEEKYLWRGNLSSPPTNAAPLARDAKASLYLRCEPLLYIRKNSSFRVLINFSFYDENPFVPLFSDLRICGNPNFARQSDSRLQKSFFLFLTMMRTLSYRYFPIFGYAETRILHVSLNDFFSLIYRIIS